MMQADPFVFQAYYRTGRVVSDEEAGGIHKLPSQGLADIILTHPSGNYLRWSASDYRLSFCFNGRLGAYTRAKNSIMAIPDRRPIMFRRNTSTQGPIKAFLGWAAISQGIAIYTATAWMDKNGVISETIETDCNSAIIAHTLSPDGDRPRMVT